MTTRAQRLTIALIPTLVTVALGAQVPRSTGPFAGTSMVLSAGPGTMLGGLPSSRGGVLVKEFGRSTAAPGRWRSEIGPDFGPKSLLFSGEHGAAELEDSIDIDAMSIGVDWINGDPGTGIGIPPPDSWQTVLFSVGLGSVGLLGSTIEAEASSSDGVAADVLSYVLPGSDGLVGDAIDSVARAVDARESGFDPTGMAVNDANAFDYFIFDYALPPAQRMQPLPSEPVFYFSVTSATAAAVPPKWWNGSAPSGATILQTRWSTESLSWSLPEPFLLPAQLGLAVGDEVDALALDRDRIGATMNMLISTTRPQDDELLLASVPATVSPSFVATLGVYQVLPEGTPVPIPDRLGTSSADNIDAACSVDPGKCRVGKPQAPFPLGLPVEPHVSAFKFWDGARGLTLRWDASTAPGVPLTAVGLPGVLLPAAGFAATGAPVTQSLASPFGGAPLEFSVRSRNGLPDSDIALFWVTTDGSALSLSRPISFVAPSPFGPPRASFDVEVVQQIAPTSVRFLDASVRAPDGPFGTTWSWDFDSDGMPDSDLRNPTVVLGAGRHDVALTVTTPFGVDTANRTLRIGSVEVCASGDDTFNADPLHGYFTIRNLGPRDIVHVEFDLVSSANPNHATMRFDTDQTGMAERFDGGNSSNPACAGTYRNDLDTTTGLDYSQSFQSTCDPFANTGWVGSVQGPNQNDWRIVAFPFTSFGEGDVFAVDIDTDSDITVGPFPGASMAGMRVRVTFDDGAIETGALAVIDSTRARVVL